MRIREPDTAAAVRSPRKDRVASRTRTANARPVDLFAFKEWQELFRARLTRSLRGLIPQLTGLRLHVLWHRATDFQEPGRILLLCPTARRRADAKGRQLKRCQRCLQRRWQPTLSPGSQGRQFTGQCGATNFCACLQVGDVCPLTLVLQASLRNGSSVSAAALHRAVILARLILHDLSATAQAQLASSALDSALQQLNHTPVDTARPHADLRRGLPGIPGARAHPTVKNHAWKLVEAMRDFVQQNSHRPIGLSDVASAMGMNGSYLSALFSQTTGDTFHHFVAEIRLSRAKALLRDPRVRVKEAALAAGYASADAFRHAFKAREGLAPDAWRAGQTGEEGIDRDAER